MKRRTFGVVIQLCLVVLLAAASAGAQTKNPRLGILLTGAPSSAAQSPQLDALTKALLELGWVDGQNLNIDLRWAERSDQLPALANELARSGVSVILAPGPEAIRAAMAATSTIAIVMIGFSDPRRVGVANLARPGGNLTGLTIGQLEVTTEKRLQLLKTTIPGLSRIVVVWDVDRLRDGGDAAGLMVAPARALALQLQNVDVKSVPDFETAFRTASAARAGAVLFMESPRAVENRALIANLGMKYRLPVMSQFGPMVEAGALLSYGPDLNDLFRRAASYLDKILKGTKPADLPIEQPIKYHLVLNMKTAKALNLAIPPAVLLQADQIVE